MTNTWIITATPQIGTLLAAGRSIGGSIIVVSLGEISIKGADKVINISLADNVPPEAAAKAVADNVAVGAEDIILVPNCPVERVLAGAVAAKLNAAVLFGVKTISAGTAELARFGGISIERVEFTRPVVAIMDGHGATEGATPEFEMATGEYYPAVVSSVEKTAASQIDLNEAKKIVSAGRGFKKQEDLKLAEDLASVLGAEVGCSRPLAEGNNWLPRDRYIGISGLKVAPEIYIAVGISGQIQHVAGMLSSRVVVAINQDENAPIFNYSDYGIVGDLYSVLPAMTAAAR